MVSTAMCSRMAILLIVQINWRYFWKHENDQQQVEGATSECWTCMISKLP